ncbi:MAG: hypothetical protein ACRBBW_21370 [Cellvibrionaceae bacterium]
MALFTNKQFLVVGGLVVAGVVYAGRKVESAKEKLNPNSPKNLVYSAVNSVGSTLTTDENFSLGSWIYDKTHPKEGEQFQ